MSQDGCKSDPVRPLPEHPEVTAILRGGAAELQRAAGLLESSGIDCTLVQASEAEPSGCCSTAIYLVVATENAAAARVVFDSDWKRGMTAEQIAALEAAAAIAVDTNSDEITCPACLTSFPDGPTECPECGLSIG